MTHIRLGIVGVDTSHCVAFAKLLHDPKNPHHIPGARIVAAYPGGSDLFSLSRDRIENLTGQLRDQFSVPLVDSIEEVAQQSDAILLESVDGRQHAEQFSKLAPFGKPVFIDKPFTTSAADAKRIIQLAQETNTPIFSSSALRFAYGFQELGEAHTVYGCEVFGPAPILSDFPGLFWYGIHTADMLFSKMGTGCKEVIVQKTDGADVVTGTWHDGRIGTMYCHRFAGLKTFGATVYTEQGVYQGEAHSKPPLYQPLLQHIINFVKTRQSPVAVVETL